MRKRLLIVPFLLLLIAGGGVGHYLWLRQQAAKEFAEVDRFLRQIPECTQWKLTYTEYRLLRRDAKPAWVRYLGISRDKVIIDHTYWYQRKRPNLEDHGYFSVKLDRNRIDKVQMLFSSHPTTPATTPIPPPSSCREEMKSLLLGKFPRFESVLDEIH